MTSHRFPSSSKQVRLRSANLQDGASILRLYETGLLVGTNDPRDPLLDLHFLDQFYLDRTRNHFWVAETLDGRIVGMVGVIDMGQQVAEIRRLRVDPKWHLTDLPCRLVAAAMDHGRKYAYLKVILDTHVHSDRKMRLLTDLGLQHRRTKPQQGKQLMEFYVNLYQDQNRSKRRREERIKS